jgi:hypothetical protein
VALVLGAQRENFGAPEQLTGKQQNPGGAKQARDLAAQRDEGPETEGEFRFFC